MSRKLFCVLSFLVFGIVLESNATHIRAGEIIAKRIDNLTLTYEFTFIGYRDNESGIQFGGGIFRFGDGTEVSGSQQGFNITETEITPIIFKAEFTLVHTFPSAQNYIVSYEEDFRNAGISNMENSVNTSFYTETLIRIDPFFGLNNTPILTVPPVDEGTPGVKFVHNPGAFDPDGDRLVYKYNLCANQRPGIRVNCETQERLGFIVPKQDEDTEVFGYQELNDPDFYENFATSSEEGNPSTLGIDADVGDLAWDAPGDIFNLFGDQCPEGVDECAEYNIAFRIEEWRNIGGEWFLLGYVTRDMQVIIYEGDNEKPDLEVPPDICVTARTVIEETVQGIDPDGHDVKLEAFGGPFIVASAATFSPDPPVFQNQPAFLTFNWSTVCGHVRASPYEVQFKVTDNPVENGVKVGPALVEFETWEITVVGPAPTGLSVDPNTGRSATLNWDKYTCNNADNIQVWRRVGDFAIDAVDCEIGMPDGAGYSLISNISAKDTTFIDNGLAPGAKYCYRIVATFPKPGEGESYVSEEVCITLEADAPVVTKVDVTRTGEDGEIQVAWIPPLDIDPTQFPPPYRYQVFRSDDLLFNEPLPASSIQSDTFFIDSGINTITNPYSYRISLFDSEDKFVDSSAVASSVRLDVTPLLQAIELDWIANTPWSNNIPSRPYHYIYRDNVLQNDPTRLELIDSVEVSMQGFSYFDNGDFNNVPLDDEITYCYFVTTFGSYDNPLLPSPLINNSQITCVRPNDNEPPCPPIALELTNEFDCEAFSSNFDCSFSNFENALQWEPDLGPLCDEDINIYRIYFSNTGLEEDFRLIDSTSTTSYIHQNLPSFKGCYYITAVDRSLNESEPSETLCIDNCPSYKLPNVFTPNGDGFNDTFTPLYSGPGNEFNGFDNVDCPRFILDVEFKVFNRQGKVIYDLSKEKEKSILINWNGKTNDGSDLPAGVYFYTAEVKFDVLASSDPKRTLNGWVQILR